MYINGPATADYDEDLGSLLLADWHHVPAFTLWEDTRLGHRPETLNGIVNGTNTYDCGLSNDTTCVGVLGKKFETVFEAGKKYRFRVVNAAADAHFQFSIDGHNLTVIASDFVPIVPFVTDSVLLNVGYAFVSILSACVSFVGGDG